MLKINEDGTTQCNEKKHEIDYEEELRNFKEKTGMTPNEYLIAHPGGMDTAIENLSILFWALLLESV